jgi:hypothetical protein
MNPVNWLWHEKDTSGRWIGFLSNIKVIGFASEW